jgi:hypothetical protein
MIDGGAARHLAFGQKAMVVVASSPELSYDLVLEVRIQERHETGRSNADLVEELCRTYGIEKRNVWYMCADNASVNLAMLEELNKRGFRIRFARCLPHCINLVVKNFVDVVDTKFKISSHLKATRGFLLAGGGVGHRLRALEFGIRVSDVDFAETRWASFVKACLCLANKLSPASMRAAELRLRELAEEGDASAAEAIAQVNVPELLWNAAYAYIESVAEEELEKVQQEGDEVEVNLKKSRKRLLAFFSDPTSFLAVQLLDVIFGGNTEEGVEPLPTIMTMTQGRPDYVNDFSSRITGKVPHAAQAARSLMDMLSNLHLASAAVQEGEEGEEGDANAANGASKLERVRRELRKRLEKQTEAVLDKARECEEPLYGGDWDAQDFEDQQVPKFRTSQEDLYPKSEQAVLDILIKACKSVDACAGLQKLEECVAALELSQHFNCNERPPTLERDDDILAYLGQQDASLHEAGPLIAGWRAYASSWKKPKETLSPRAVCIFWRTYKDGSNPSLKALGALALKEFSRPISAACCERVFSYLTQMDTPDRATMGKKTLQMLLFLRGNWRLVHDMVDEEYAADVVRRAAIAQVHKRRREAVQGEEAEATAAAAAAAATAAMEEDAEDSQEDRCKLEQLAAEEIAAAAAAKAAKDSSEGSDSGSQDSGREFYDNE